MSEYYEEYCNLHTEIDRFKAENKQLRGQLTIARSEIDYRRRENDSLHNSLMSERNKTATPLNNRIIELEEENERLRENLLIEREAHAKDLSRINAAFNRLREVIEGK